MYYSELKAKLTEGMTTAVMSYGFDFQVDRVDGVNNQGDRLRAIGTERIDNHENYWEKHEMLPWEIKNALAAKQRRDNVLLWLKAAAGNNLQSVKNDSLPNVPDWQKVKFKR